MQKYRTPDPTKIIREECVSSRSLSLYILLNTFLQSVAAARLGRRNVTREILKLGVFQLLDPFLARTVSGSKTEDSVKIWVNNGRVGHLATPPHSISLFLEATDLRTSLEREFQDFSRKVCMFVLRSCKRCVKQI